MKNNIFSFIFGIAGAIAFTLPVQAQSFEPFPRSVPGCTIVNYICYNTVNTDEGTVPAVAGVPAGYNNRYIIGAYMVGENSFVFIYDTRDEQTSAYMMVDQESNLVHYDGKPMIGGNFELLDEVVGEIVALLIQLRLQ